MSFVAPANESPTRWCVVDDSIAHKSFSNWVLSTKWLRPVVEWMQFAVLLVGLSHNALRRRQLVQRLDWSSQFHFLNWNRL